MAVGVRRPSGQSFDVLLKSRHQRAGRDRGSLCACAMTTMHCAGRLADRRMEVLWLLARAQCNGQMAVAPSRPPVSAYSIWKVRLILMDICIKLFPRIPKASAVVSTQRLNLGSLRWEGSRASLYSEEYGGGLRVDSICFFVCQRSSACWALGA